MCRRRLSLIIAVLLAIAVVPWGDGQARAQSSEAVEKSDRSAAMEALRERAERVQAKRKARITHEDRQAAADRAKAGKGAAKKAAPAQSGKGVAQ